MLINDQNLLTSGPGATLRLSRLILASVGAVAVTISLVTPALAANASGSITVSGASSPLTSVGLLSVTVQSTTPLTNLSVSIMSGTTEELDLPFSDFSLTSGSTTSGTWTLNSPITTTQLSLGTYTVDASATDSGGDSVTGADAGTLYFVVVPTITLTATPTNVDYGNQDVTFSGSVTGLAPDGTTTPLSGAQVQISAGLATYRATTETDGSFQTAPEPVNPAFSPFQASINETATTWYASSNSVNITATYDPVTLTANVTHPSVNYGQSDTITGAVTYGPGGTYVPLADATVTLTASYEYTTETVIATTDARGDYTATLTAQDLESLGGTSYWTATAGGSDYLQSQSVDNLQVIVKMPTHITQFSAALNQFYQLHVKGCFAEAVGASQENFNPEDLSLQYATGKSGPWRNLGSVSYSQQGTDFCHDSAAHWSGTYNVRVTNGYYRLHFSGSSGLLPSTSSVLHRSKTPTKITGFKVSPASTSRNNYVTVSGKIWRHLRSWKGFGGRSIYLCLIHQNTLYCYKHHMTANSSGGFSGQYKAVLGGRWFAEYLGNGTYFAAVSRQIHVRVSGAAAGAIGAAALDRLGITKAKGLPIGNLPWSSKMRS
jgi:hypothetical protein